ncbi:MAG: membrane protein insertase YidC [Cyclobacteriaceae bacterium]|nr:membrane protein insertase YidC [Cyclobacteriaceae bacterium]
MDRNSAIGLTLIAVLLLLYFNYFSPTPPPPVDASSQVTAVDSSTHQIPQQSVDTLTEAVTPNDSLLQQQYGGLSDFINGTEKTTTVENNDLSVTLSSRGGIFSEVRLKKFKTYYQKPLYLVTPQTNTFSLLALYEGREVDLFKLYYQGETRTQGDSTVVTYTAQLSPGSFVKHTYSIPSSGYEIGYTLEVAGLTSLTGDLLTFKWNDKVPSQEKDLTDSRRKTSVNYYTFKDGFDNIKEASNDTEIEAVIDPLKWVSFKQKFFISAIIANRSFSGGEVTTSVPAADTATVKNATMKLFVPRQDVASPGAQFRYYFGPNKYSLLGEVTEGFSKNLNIGWPPIVWVNQFLIIPIFKFLEKYISNYGIIIMILVLIVKLILSPLSYKSYLGMAKMKLLKPEQDLLKETYGDDMTKIQQEQMKLYQQAGVNPFSGCIPLVLQMPILFAMFYFFPVSIELRQSSFLWAEDLSTYDSIVNLPFTIPFYGSHVSLFVLLMTASTMIYTWQNNQMTGATGPMKSMSLFMPLIFMFVLNSFAAGLSFYYFISNLVTFAQQAIIRKFVDEDKIRAVMEEHKKSIAAGDGKKSKFMTKLQEAMKASEEARKKGKK